jgi:23S rRNA-/tRNA-specific pseudouridylate synthase
LQTRSALEEGRVFVAGQRADNRERELSPGEVVEIFPPRSAAPNTRILAIEDELIFAYKPAGIPTEPDERGSAGCVLSELAPLIADPSWELHALSRLDTGVSGVVLISGTPDAAKRVNELRSAGRLRRRYVAVASGIPEPRSGLWNASIGRGARGERKVSGRDAESAETRYTCIASVSPRPNERFSLLALEPITGRTHQLRVHASAHGVPLLGDRRYNGPTRWIANSGSVRAWNRIALHAAWVEVPTPAGALRVTADPAAELAAWWCELGGSEQDFEAALADEPRPAA